MPQKPLPPPKVLNEGIMPERYEKEQQNSMKEINYRGRLLQYEGFTDCHEFGDISYTEFYDGMETFTRKKYYFFGKEITYTRPRLLFTIFADADDPQISKEQWRKWISEEIALLSRKDELKRGELI